ncbi:hypothetical protein GCM10010862_10220 [Devosia nitrariae]|uniref:Uncharacterized protein n=2 Tax=Devosia nitrariae TaxID=2071872 RepID=A0ABQ5W1P0_9HYPH|nr:hypothetical protein GCM10010862_10220 [Devosia nitrariae]
MGPRIREDDSRWVSRPTGSVTRLREAGASLGQRQVGRWLSRIVSKRLSKGNFEMADNNLVALALADGLLPRPSREDTIAQLLAYADELDDGNSGQLPPLSALWPAFLESLDRRFVQPAINGFLAPSRALHGDYSGSYLYPDRVIRPYSPEMIDDASAMAGLVGLGGVVPRGQPMVNPLTSLESRSARIYDPLSVSQRPFEADYPFGAQANEAGRLAVDIEGRPLSPDAHLVGREITGGSDRPLPTEAMASVAQRSAGASIETVAPRALGGDAGRLVKTTDRRSGNTEYEILLNRDLTEVAKPRVAAHEVGHLIDSIAGGIPTERLNRELRAIYNDLNNPQSYGRPFGPEQSGYTRPFVPRELMAEAVRAYMVDPNYIKTVAPKVAARIRQYVNQNPQLRDVIQFNAGGVPLPAQPARPEPNGWFDPETGNEWVPGYGFYDPETGKWSI